MRQRSTLLVSVLAFTGIMFGSNTLCLASVSRVYIAQSAIGLGNGSSCANAFAYAFFNTIANWGSGSNQIGPGTTVHLCGTIASALAAQGSGSSGSPITILFDTGAKISMSACPADGCLNLQNYNYILVDGGTTCGYISGSVVPCNGTIESTLNGTAGAACKGGTCSQQATTNGITIGGSGVEIRNLNIWNMYVHRSVFDNATNCQCQAILGNSTGALIHNNIAHDNAWSIVSSGSNTQIYNNSIYNSDHCFAVTNGTSGVVFHDNQCYNPYVWDTDSNAWHHDGIHLYTYDTPITGTLIYNNFFWGDWGNNVTAHIFIEGNSLSSPVNYTQIFNNFFRDCLSGDNGGTCTSTGPQGDGAILAGTQAVRDTGTQVYNNTFTTGNCGIFTNTSAISYQNNVTCGYGVYPPGSASFTVDANNVAPDSKVSMTTGRLSAGSSAIGAGANLTSLGNTRLDVDKAGVPRPSTGAWDAGAYQYTVLPAPPTKLSGVAQ